ncbi:S9 family peptidase [Pseudonocardia charpentierae]|uniref:Acyl-peptide hydrolase n=1 Tax=Pseudonocardia charpentierae TaxID=3075545 RepID=A0ABU2NHJ1_9PSEU|nr:prolyl oligopeptidase family serine peptidase [Pseudonocardia sp. DSM 45834]MDT0352948.1 prolyl oligopeptidase family serine peptidase [Pseudonocardia sp. DSM 45834]
MTEADFVRRRMDRLSGEHDPALFPTAYSCPIPSPDGRMLAWISDRDGRPRAWVAQLPPDGSAVVEPGWPLPTDGDSHDRDGDVPWDVQKIAWSPDGYWLACQLAPGGGERTRVRLISPDGSQIHDLAPSAPAVTLGSWSPNGRQLGITIFGAVSGDGAASLVDVRDGTSTMLTSGPAALVCAISGDGAQAVVRVGRRGARRLEHFDLRSGRCTELLPGGEANVADARFGITGGQLFVHSDAAGERPALLAVGLNGDAEPSLPYVVAGRDEHDLDLVSLDPMGARAALVWNVDGRSEIELLDLRSGLTEPLPCPPGDVVTGAAFTRDGRALLIGNEGPTVPPTITRIALDTLIRHGAAAPHEVRGGRVGAGSVTVTPLLPAAPRDAGHLVDPVLHHFPGEDGLPLSGWLFRPTGAFGSTPTLIWLHGGPEAQERPIFQPLFQALLAEGVAVFAPNVRGSGGYGRTFSQADDLERRFVAITDVRAAVTSLVEQGLADPGRIGVSGRSYGGYLTLVALAWFPELFRVGVDVCGISDFTTFYAQTEPWIAAAAVTKYGDPAAHATLLRELSPIHSADRITAPLLVVHGAYDTNVPIVEAEQIVEALRDRGASPGFLLFDDEGHEVHSTANRVLFVREVVRWVTGHLLDVGEQTA